MFTISFGENIARLTSFAALIGTFIFIIAKTFGLMAVSKVNIENMGEAESPSKLGQKFLEALWVIC